MKKLSKSSLKYGFYSSILLAVLTFISLLLGMIAVPPAGPNCPGNCMNYPYRELLQYYPRDYYWMFCIFFQLLVFMVFIISIQHIAPRKKRLAATLSTAFAFISVTVLLIDYYIQFSVVPMSMVKCETDGIALFTQYNGHGIFIAMEELGYFTMSISFLFLSMLFNKKNSLHRALKLFLLAPSVITVIAFIIYSVKYGIDRDYRFEVVTLTANWLSAIISGILISIYLNRKLKKSPRK